MRQFSSVLRVLTQKRMAFPLAYHGPSAVRFFHTVPPGEMHFRRAVDYGKENNYVKGIECLNAAATLDHREAQYLLACSYWDGLGVEENQTKAIEYLEAAAKQGHPGAQCHLSGCYYRGIPPLEKDWVKSFVLLTAAADQNWPEARYIMAVRYATGECVEKNLDRALLLTRTLASEGYERAQHSLGKYHAKGQTDLAMALRMKPLGPEEHGEKFFYLSLYLAFETNNLEDTKARLIITSHLLEKLSEIQSVSAEEEQPEGPINTWPMGII